MEAVNLPFTGRYVNAVDAKGRVSVPAVFRDLIAARCLAAAPGDASVKNNELSLAITPSFDRVRAYDAIGIRQLSAKLEVSVSQVDVAERDEVLATKASSTMGGMMLASFDSAGRLVLPPMFREFAEIGDHAVFWGSQYFFEIFSPKHAMAAFADDPVNSKTFPWELKQKGIAL